jgi:mRNA interferase MazF
MVKKQSYVPQRGDLIWLEFAPQSGHEQTGRRPGLVLSPDFYNRPSGLALVCPITSKVKGYPFEVLVREGSINGAVLSDQLKSVDWKQRRAKFIARGSTNLVTEVTDKITLLTTGS